jgi:hypothetical protein
MLSPRAEISACRLTGPFIEIRQAPAEVGERRRPFMVIGERTVAGSNRPAIIKQPG